MKYRVEIAESAADDIVAQVDYMRSRNVSGETIDRWCAHLLNKIGDLATWPRKCAVALDESDYLGVEIRRIVFGNYLVFYRIFDSDKRVRVYAIRHGAQDSRKPKS